MNLKPEHLAERKKYLLNNVEKGEESAYVSAKYALDYHDTIDALTQTIAELDAVRGLAKEWENDPDSWNPERAGWSLASELRRKQLLSILDAPTKPKEARNGEE